MMSGYNALYPNQRQGKDVYLQGSRQMDSVTRQYYERSPDAAICFPPPGRPDYPGPASGSTNPAAGVNLTYFRCAYVTRTRPRS
jgi:hypothetical protein